MVSGNVASEDCHGADTEAQGEEGLSHGGVYHLEPAVFLDLAKVGNEIEADAFSRARQSDTAYAQQNKDKKQRDHHDLGDPFHAVLQAHAADTEADKNNNNHPERHGAGLRQHLIKDTANLIRRQSGEFSPEHFYNIGQHPAGDRGVEHHEQIVACHGRIGKQMPFRVFRFQYMEASCR